MTGDLEAMRRVRGEGWEWARAATEPCPQCGDHPGALVPTELGPKLVGLASDWRTFLLEADDSFLRTSPEPGVFSPIQYGAHVRDIIREYSKRVVLALKEDNPTVSHLNPGDEVWERYNHLDAAELASDIQAESERLASLASELDEAGWARTVTRDSGPGRVYRFTLAGLLSYAVHEAYHHLLDAKGILGERSAQ
jgi:DinB superfamily